MLNVFYMNNEFLIIVCSLVHEYRHSLPNSVDIRKMQTNIRIQNTTYFTLTFCLTSVLNKFDDKDKKKTSLDLNKDLFEGDLNDYITVHLIFRFLLMHKQLLQIWIFFYLFIIRFIQSTTFMKQIIYNNTPCKKTHIKYLKVMLHIVFTWGIQTFSRINIIYCLFIFIISFCI